MSYNSEEYKKVSPWYWYECFIAPYMGMKYAGQQNP